MKTLLVLSALLIAAYAQNNNENDTQINTTESSTTEETSRPDCKCSLPLPPPPATTTGVSASLNPIPPPPVYQYPNPSTPFLFNPYQQIPYYPPPAFPYAGPNTRPRSPVPRSASQPYPYQWQPVQQIRSSRGLQSSQRVPAQSNYYQPASRGTNSQSGFQYSQGPNGEQSYRGDFPGYWFESEPAPVQQNPVQQVYYVPDENAYEETPVQQMPVQQVLVMYRH